MVFCIFLTRSMHLLMWIYFDLNAGGLGVVNLGPHKLTSGEPNSSGVDGNTRLIDERLDVTLQFELRELDPNEDRLSMSLLVMYKIPPTD